MGVYKIKRVIDVKKSNYNKASYKKALEDERIKELRENGSLCCEYGIPTGDRASRLLTIMMDNVCARIVNIFDDYIEVEPMGIFKHFLSEQVENNPDKIRAVMRYIGRVDDNGKMSISKIITFDIILLEEKS